jgi:hypothetical protein
MTPPPPPASEEPEPEVGGDGEGDRDRRLKPERRQGDRRQHEQPVVVDRRAGGDRRQAQRRTPRNINAYDLGPDELEFIQAIHAHKQKTGRAFPTWSEVLRILRELGYEKRR